MAKEHGLDTARGMNMWDALDLLAYEANMGKYQEVLYELNKD